MNRLKCFVCDIDGTIANIAHRLHYIKGEVKDWKKFKSLAKEDGTHDEVIEVIRALAYANYKIVLCTGRTIDEEPMTLAWLDVNNIPADAVYMRENDDHRDDDVVKVELLEKIKADGYDIVAWFDDRTRVVNAIRAEGVKVFQVRPGDF
ncbi:MAG: HAD family acid phosphatase [Methylocystis sp.]